MRWWSIGWLLAAGEGVAQEFEELKIGFSTHKPPFIFERENRGLEYDIVVAAAHAAGFIVKPYYAPMERLHRSFRLNDMDAMATTNEVGGVAPHYSLPYIYYQNVAWALTSRHYRITSIGDLAHHSIRAFQRASHLLGREYREMAESNPEYREEAQQIARNRLLYSGRVDVVIGERRILRYFNREVYAQVDTSQPITEYMIFPATGYQVGFHDAALRNRFDQGLESIRASGEYLRIEQRYAVY